MTRDYTPTGTSLSPEELVEEIEEIIARRGPAPAV